MGYNKIFHHRKEEIMTENIIQKPTLSSGKTIEYDGILFEVPEGYRVFSEKGIQKEILDKYGNVVDMKIISYRTVLIKSILLDYDTENEKIELVFLDTGKTLIVEKSDLYSSSKIIKLADKGLQVNSNNAKIWIDFLTEYEAINREKLPKKQTISRLGWINQNTFIPYNKNGFELDVNDNTASWIKELEEKGSLLKWVEQMKELRNNYIFRFVLATSFSAPLLKITGTRSFVIYNWAMSKRWKNSVSILCYVGLGIS